MRLLRRVAITLAGGVLVVLGVVLLVLPGPGLLLVAAGLLVLGLEYDWARRRAVVVRDRAWVGARQAASSPGSAALAVLGGLGLLAAGVCWGVLDQLPASGWWTGGSLIAGGVAALVLLVVSVVAVRREGGRTADVES